MRPRNQKRGYTIKLNRIVPDEDVLHQQVVKWLRFAFTKVMYHSDAAGELMTDSMRIRQSKVNMEDMSWPDLEIPEARRGYFGMYVEIKKDGEQLFKANGEYKTDHLKRQARCLEMLTARNHYAIFAIGFNEVTERIKWYLSGPPTKVSKPKNKVA